MELIEALGIDFRLLLVQILNFLVLLLILYWFAYKPVLGILEKRRKMIEESVKEAEKINQESLALEERKKEVLTTARKEALRIIDESKIESEEIKKEVLKKAQQEAKEIIERAYLTMEREKQEKFNELKKEIEELVIIGVESLLKKEVDRKTNAKIIKEALRNLEVN